LLPQAQIKRLKSLPHKKYRQQEGEILLEGYRLIQQALIAKADISQIWMTKDYIKSRSGIELKQILAEKNIAMEIASEKSIQRVCDSQNSQGVIAVMPLPKYKPIKEIPSHSLYLDDIADPGNMGTLLRTAVWFGIDSVFLSPHSVDPLHSKVLRSAMGAHFHFQNLITISPDDLFEKYTNTDYAILGSDMNGESLQDLQIDIEKRWILILGNEAHGIHNSLQSYITHSISIPGYSRGMDSLNVAVAGGILLYNLTASTRLLQTEKK
jgi:TrmH family RNA methyltransferase